jgi:hypothetical protein
MDSRVVVNPGKKSGELNRQDAKRTQRRKGLRIQDRILFLILFFLSATLATWRFNSLIFEESFHHPGIHHEP